MARSPRLGPSGIPQHIIQRGNNRQICFADEADLAFYAQCLKKYRIRFQVAVHAWVFMTNHVHLLATPAKDGAVSEMMQALGRHYVGYFNRRYARTGTLWEGRFRSNLVESETYLLICQRYIELNPVRAGMVNDPADYMWSSYQCSALGRSSELFQPHDLYIGLGASPEERRDNYRSLFRGYIPPERIEFIRQGVNKGIALGSKGFTEEIEQRYLCRQRPAKIGRPPKVGSDQTFQAPISLEKKDIAGKV